MVNLTAGIETAELCCAKETTVVLYLVSIADVFILKRERERERDREREKEGGTKGESRQCLEFANFREHKFLAIYLSK
jgi:hypothetical protein